MFAFLTPQVWKLIGIALVVMSVVGGVFYVHHDGYNKGIAAQKAVDQAQAMKDMEIAKQKTQDLQSKLNEANHALLKAQADLFTLATSNRNSVSQLRQQLDTYNGNMSNYPSSAANRITTLSSVVEECSARLVEVANAADTASAQVIMFQAAWPK